MIDPDSLGVNASIVRSVLMRRRLKKFPRLLERPPISECKTPLRKSKKARVPLNFKKPLRNATLKKPAISSELETIIANSGKIEYCPTISTQRRKSYKIVRNELNEKNPYCHPIEGFRHNYRSAIETFQKVEVACQRQLPVHKKLSYTLKQSETVKKIVNNIYKQTSPEVSSFVENRQTNPNHSDHSTPNEYQSVWREVERSKVLKDYRERETKRIEIKLERFQNKIDKKKKFIESEINRIESEMTESQKILFDLLRDLTAEKHEQHQKEVHLEVLLEEYGLVRSQLYTMMSQMDQYQVYRNFLHVFSPYEWQQEHKITKLSSSLSNGEDQLFPRKSFCLDNLDELYNTITTKLEKPTLYFKSPEEVIKFFVNLEDVSFTLYSHAKAIGELAEEGNKFVLELTRGYFKELEILRDLEVELLEDILWEEKRANLLKNFCTKFIFNEFANLVFELEAVKIAVEECYCDVVTSNDLNLGAAHLMKAIELQVVHLIEGANPSDPENIRITQQINFISRMRDIAQKRFEKTFREYEFILKGVRKSYDYNMPAPRRRLMARSPPPLAAVDLEEEVVQIISPEELEYQYFFGDPFINCLL